MWLEELAASYLRQYETIQAEQRGGSWGYAFTPGSRRRQVGFLVGFLIGEPKLAARTRVAVHLP
ncbi:MAG: hypothetical protein ACRD35_01210, partial [Candidatus Acidiferrales bacterium]